MNDVGFSKDSVLVPRAARFDEVDAPSDSSAPLVTQYLRIAVRWRWLILGAISIAVLLGLLLTLLATPLYTATARIEINREANRIVQVDDVQPESSAVDTEFYQTQYGLLQSRSLAERVVRELRLADNADFFTMFGASDTFENFAGSGGNRAQRTKVAAEILLDNLDISPIRLSRLVDVRFTSPDPDFSTRVANAWTSGFIESNLERRFEATAYARRFLEQRLAQLRQRLEESERQLVGYASNQAIINIPVGNDASGRAQERSLTVDSLAALNTALAEATADRVTAESRLRQTGGGAVAEALTNPAIAAMRQRRAEAAAEYSRLMTQFEPDYPPAQALQAQIAQLDQSIAREEARVQGSLRNAYQTSVERERALNRRVEDLKQGFLDQRRRSIEYNIFQRDVDTNRELYDGLLQRYKEIGVAGGVGTNNVSIVDPAQRPDRTSYPRPLINLLIALLVGSVAGIGLALVREQIDETITDPTELEKRIGTPLLGVVPASDADDLLAEIRDPKSSLIEAYHSLQANLAFSTDHGVPRTLSVTSTRPAEGKSITSYAIAYTIARGGARTLLVDGDMRSPSVHSEVGIDNSKGLSTYLAGGGNLAELIQQPAQEAFAVLPAGPQPPNAAELLRGNRLETLIAELSGMFDHIIVDSPPVMGLADAPIISSRTEATVFVMEASGVKARVARLALARLRQGRAQLLGAVLTKFESKRSHFGYGYDYGYGYGYGRDDQKGA